jgi:hypothetical protein
MTKPKTSTPILGRANFAIRIFITAMARLVCSFEQFFFYCLKLQNVLTAEPEPRQARRCDQKKLKIEIISPMFVGLLEPV